ncbi:Stf0 family sulphotransferase [Actinopolymorpha pittospori]
MFNRAMSAPASPTDSYLICATPRTGSSLLCGLLASTGVGGRPEAYFRQPNEQSWAERWRIVDRSGHFDYADYVRAAITAGSTDNRVFGAKVMWGTLDEVVAKLATVHPKLAGADLELLNQAFGRTRFVFVRRADVVAQAVSWLRAEQTNLWYVGDSGVSGREPEYDLDGIRGFVRMIEEHNAAWRTWFSSFDVQPHEVVYEELIADMSAVTLGILDHLGLPTTGSVTPRHQRQADDINAEWMARYRAEAARLD